MNFRTRTAGTYIRDRSPEVVFFAFSEDFFCRYTYLVVPYIKCFIVIFVDSDIKSVRIKMKIVCHKIPRPGDNFFFIIIAEREIAEHFKKCMVARCSAYVFYVRIFSAGTCTFLAGCNSFGLIRTFFIPEEVRNKLQHTRCC